MGNITCLWRLAALQHRPLSEDFRALGNFPDGSQFKEITPEVTSKEHS